MTLFGQSALSQSLVLGVLKKSWRIAGTSECLSNRRALFRLRAWSCHTYGAFPKQHLFLPGTSVLFSDLVANKDSIKYLIMMNDILAAGNSEDKSTGF